MYKLFIYINLKSIIFDFINLFTAFNRAIRQIKFQEIDDEVNFD